jgi:bifunctional DNA-binding transcriptional regulator/antitoxin component of YhaV-PrlF toxin-antitoxin module
VEEVVVTSDFKVEIPEELRKKLGIKQGAIILQPLRPKEALEILETIADRYLGGPRRINAVRLVEESLDREAGIH